jgi:hypothetical protein
MNIFESWGIGTGIFIALYIGGLYGYDKLKNSESNEDNQIRQNSRNHGGFRKTRKNKNKRI